MQGLIELLGLLAASATKFFLAPPLAIYLGHGFLDSIAITSTGGILGFFIFYKFGIIIHKWYMSLFSRKTKPKFNRRNRTIVKLKIKYGLWGLAILTPCLLSVPIGAFLASRYYSKDRRAFPVFITFIILWSILLTSISLYFSSENI